MSFKFWAKKTLISFVVGWTLIFAVQFFKSTSVAYACEQAAVWGTLSAVLYLLILRYKLRKNSTCAAKHN